MKQGVLLGRHSAGFTLVELMVALVIGLIIVLGAGQLFLMGKQSYDRLAELALRQESLRYLTDLVSLDIRTASNIAEAADSKLALTYEPGVRPNDPYCPGDDLSRVVYTFDEDNSSVMIQVQCLGGGASGPEALIEGVVDLRFDGGDPLFVEVGVDFATMSGEAANNAVFNFVVARREEILSGF
ncbi:PilW family protein [Halomonas kalidii]|uniref:Prepilin-type N-terminal cleavage/methylation domain-containing protein n=1 Tax=Halomonas kalidii TaxID=3043293 RepID=A0ABT6VGA1_9GAMM|nr:prepilin-type N-terminal cleavage/methylation domain-containing protein [Halomonas kalidii]MDI5932614.1 prepilin-type N-terminal cleavage/methylation domain-containing protein [Halomonas kalidii]